MRCTNCENNATRIGERESPGVSLQRRAFCSDPKCQPKEPGWVLYDLSKEEQARR